MFGLKKVERLEQSVERSIECKNIIFLVNREIKFLIEDYRSKQKHLKLTSEDLNKLYDKISMIKKWT